MMALMTEIVFSGFVSKVVNDIVDVSKDKIIKAVKDRKVKNQNLESQIYNITVDVLNDITDNKYKNNQDEIYDVAEVLLKTFKNGDENELENIKSCLKVICSNIDENKCMEFKLLFYKEIGKDEYSELYRAILLLLLEQKNQYDYAVNEQLYQKLIEIKQKIDKLNQKLDGKKEGNENSITQDTSVKIKNDKKQDYIRNWNSRMFLHQDNDENPLTLADAFITPDYKVYKSFKQIDFSDDDTLDEIIEKFMKYERTSTMLITGLPGIGKTTITSWLANEYKENNNVIILRFRDWESNELEYGVLKAIYNTLELNKRDLENKILVLDGFDEMKSLDIREKLLNNFFNDIKDYKNFKCIITSRPAYITSYYFNVMLELEEFDIYRIESFCEKITGKKLNKKEKIESNRDVLGIPVILYMAIMTNVDISENPTKPELYNRIFSEVGGIFDKFYFEGIEYDNGTQVLRNPENIKHYLKFLCETAFKMFKKNELILLRAEYEIPKLEFGKNKISILEFPIKHLFENSNACIEFIHKSICEYFVSEYIYNLIVEALNDTIQLNTNLAGVLGNLLKNNKLTVEILEFLKYKIRNSKLNNQFDIVYKAFQTMIQDGMTYHTHEYFKNVIECEMCVFINMLEIIHLWKEKYYIKYDSLFWRYIRYNRHYGLNLSRVILESAKDEFINKKIDLSGVYLENVYLKDANIRRINLSRANLSKADLSKTKLGVIDLSKANLSKANLSKAILIKADLRGADLRGADLREAILLETDLREADLREADLGGADLRGADLRGADLNKTIFDKN